MKQFTLHFNDGSDSRYGLSEEGALKIVARKYETVVSELVTDDQLDSERPRILVWENEASSENDDGRNAVAELEPV